jgi:predicted regulator of Ras-like GTPase activity (Roadblock/LC7/MglB family)
MNYHEFLDYKARIDPPTGLTDIPDLPEELFEFQADIVRWALRRGRAAIFAQTGLGKSLMELAWGDAINRATGGDVLLLTPLAVAGQMVREADKFLINANQANCQSEVQPGLTVTNYEKLHHFDLSHFTGVILDESSILKAFDGKTRKMLVESCAGVPYRLCATATPAPNDFVELGNHAEFLGVMTFHNMQSVFFTIDMGATNSAPRLKGHAEGDFWRWMCSWSVLLRKPSDLGYSDDRYDLPPLVNHEHILPVEGELAKTLSQRLRARRESLTERVAHTFKIISDVGVVYGVEAGVRGESADKATTASRIAGEEQAVSSRQSAAKQGEKERVLSELRQGQPRKVSILGSEEARIDERAAESGLLDIRSAAGKIPYPGEAVASGESREAESAADSQIWADLTADGRVDGSAKSQVQDLRVLGYEQSECVSGGRPLPLDEYGAGIALLKVQFGYWADERRHQKARSSSQVPDGLFQRRPWLIWCNLNAEQDALEARFGDLAFSIRGADAAVKKEQTLLAWLRYERPILISKPSIMGFGLNLQLCADTVFVGLNDSFEQVYQAVRRFWRFGQTSPVNVHFVAASTEGAVVENLKRKEADAERMGAMMVEHMADISSAVINGSARTVAIYAPTKTIKIPKWLQQDVAA